MSQLDLFTSIIKGTLADTHNLPSLPKITMQIRQAVNDPNTTSVKLANQIRNDPALSAMLLKAVASPVFLGEAKILSLEILISYLGFNTVSDLVMLHSVRSMFTFKNARLKNLYSMMWIRQYEKVGTSVYLAQKLSPRIKSDVLLASLLTELGSLALLSAFENIKDPPSKLEYIALCRKYSKLLSIRLLKKWDVDSTIVDVIKGIGKWQESEVGPLNVVDIINLAVYHTSVRKTHNHRLPPIKTLEAYKKLSAPDNEVYGDHELLLIKEHRHLIDEIVHSFI